MTETVTPGRVFYDRHIQFLVDKDVDGLVETNYAPDAELVTFQNVIKGREALRTYFRGYIEMLGDIVVESTDKFAETDDAILFEATVRSNLGRARVYDAWIAARRTDHPSLHRRDGRMSHHTQEDDRDGERPDRGRRSRSSSTTGTTRSTSTSRSTRSCRWSRPTSSASGRRVRPTASRSSRAGTTRSPTSSSTKSTR